MTSELGNRVFLQAVGDYHQTDDVHAPLRNPYPAEVVEHLLYKKAWIDTVQWHLEDIIRDPGIDPVRALQIKRRIDASNQERTDVVEYVDAFFLQQYKDVAVRSDATVNTESPAWALDRLSILALKIYHMRIEAARSDTDESHKASARQKLAVLQQQRQDLSGAIDDLLTDIAAGRKYMKVYKQMKMYNDETLNPVLYAAKNGSR